MQYRLSNRQRKDLLVRGTPLKIALPIPPDVPPEGLDAWARDVLDVEPALIRGVEECELVVAPSASQGGLAPILGAIISQSRGYRWSYILPAVVVTVAPDDPRHAPVGPEWPGSVVGPGWELPRPGGVP